jgi:hypothetical protein
VEFSCPSPLNTYSYVQGESLGSTRKSVKKLLIVYVYYQPKSCNTHAEHEWAGGTFLRQWKKVPPAHAQLVYLAMDVWCAVVSVFCLWQEIVFDIPYKLRVQCKMGRRNRYLEWRDDGQMNPRGYTNFNFYIKNLRLFIFITDGQTDRQTDGWMDGRRN